MDGITDCGVDITLGRIQNGNHWNVLTTITVLMVHLFSAENSSFLCFTVNKLRRTSARIGNFGVKVYNNTNLLAVK